MISIRRMGEADVGLGMRLKSQAGWNQTEADWRRFLALAPASCFVGELDGRPAGTVAAFVFGDVAWIAMVLVDPAMRGRGLGTALTEHALGVLDDRGVPSVRLDATPLGRPIYEKLGFRAEYELTRYEGTLSADTAAAEAKADGGDIELVPFADDLAEAVARLDRQVTGTPRGPLLERLREEPTPTARVAVRHDEVVGYAFSRDGSRAAQIGPAAVTDQAAGEALLIEAGERLVGESVFIDIPMRNTAAVGWAQRRGLTAQRTLTRMVRGKAVADRPDHIWASSGPEKG